MNDFYASDADFADLDGELDMDVDAWIEEMLS